MRATRSFLKTLGLPESDAFDLPASSLRFDDGGQYRIEIPSVEGPNAMEAALAAADELDVPIHRVSQGSGIMLQTDRERIIGEAAWGYQHRPAMSPLLKKRQEGLSEEVKELAWKAQHRLCSRYRRLMAKGKLRQKVAMAVGRELLGFVWAIGMQVEREQQGYTKGRGRAA